MQFLYVFILQFCTIQHVSNDHLVRHQELMIYCILQLYRNHANVSNCSVLRLGLVQSNCSVLGLVQSQDRAVRHVCMVCTELQNAVNHKLLMMNEMVVRNMQSCTKL